MAENAIPQQELENRVYIGPTKTGDNIDAKRIANYVWDGVSSWVRETQPSGGGGAITNDGTFAKETGGNLATIATQTSGLSTSANQTTGNTSLSTIATNTANAGTPTVSGTVTANAGTNLNTSALALESGGNLATIVTDLTNGTQQTKLTDGTNIANVLAPGTANSTGNALLIANTLSNTVSWSTTTAQAVASTEVGNYKAAFISTNTTGTNATHTVQGSNDNSTWFSVAGVAQSSGNTFVNTCTAVNGYVFPINYRYFRINVTGISAGTSSGTVIFGTNYAPATQGAAQSNTWTVGSNSATGSAVPANAFYLGINNQAGNLAGMTSLASDGVGASAAPAVQSINFNGTNWDRQRSANGASNTTGTGLLGANALVWDGTNYQKTNQPSLANNTTGVGILSAAPMGMYNSSAPTVTNGDYYALQMDVAGNLKEYLATKLDNVNDSITTYPFGHSYAHIATGQATTVVKNSSGILHSITFNSAATATNVTTVYDNASGSGTVIAIPAATTATIPVTLTYDIAFANGLTIITATANGGDMTISYR